MDYVNGTAITKVQLGFNTKGLSISSATEYFYFPNNKAYATQIRLNFTLYVANRQAACQIFQGKGILLNSLLKWNNIEQVTHVR